MSSIGIIIAGSSVCITCMVNMISSKRVIVIDKSEELTDSLSLFQSSQELFLENRVMDLERIERIETISQSNKISGSVIASVINYILKPAIEKIRMLIRLRYIFSFVYH